MAEPSQSLTPPEHPTLSSMFLSQVQRMDAEAWSRLVSLFGPIVYRWCRTSGVGEHDASDVVQEVFASVARGIPTFQRQKPVGSFRSWLATITRNCVRDYFRAQACVVQATGGTGALRQLQRQADSIDSTIHPSNTQSSIVRRVLREVEAEFEPATWQAFWLTAVENRSASDVAHSTELTSASVYQAKSRVLRRLRERMAEIPD